LDPHQVEGVARIEAMRWRTLVSDEMGLGKGPMALGAVTLCPEAWPLLIIAPVSMLGAWREEVRTWLRPEPEIINLTHPRVLDSLSPSLQPGQRRVLLSNWSFCSLHGAAIQEGALSSIRGIIGDESQAMTSPDSARTRSFWRLRTPAVLRLLLTGTPMPNGRGIELWSQLAAVESKGLLPLRAWKQRFCGVRLQHVAGKGRGGKPKVIQVFDGRSNLVELAKVRLCRELRRTKAELGPDRLPKKARYVYPVTLTVADHVRIEAEKEVARQALIARAEKAGADLLADGGTESQAQAKMEAMLRASAVACLGRVRALVGHLKIAHVVPLLRDLLEEGHRVVLFGFHLAVLRAAAEAFGRTVCTPDEVLSGVDLGTPEARTDLVRRWGRGEGKVLVLSGKYNSGITLISGARMVVLERFWIPAMEQQLEDRIHRRGQTEDCAYWYAMAAGTTDDAAGKVITWKETGISASQGSISSRALQVLFAGQVYPGVLGAALASGMGPLTSGVDEEITTEEDE
jgi:SNF2 family DNA or RNA helicase